MLYIIYYLQTNEWFAIWHHPLISPLFSAQTAIPIDKIDQRVDVDTRIALFSEPTTTSIRLLHRRVPNDDISRLVSAIDTSNGVLRAEKNSKGLEAFALLVVEDLDVKVERRHARREFYRLGFRFVVEARLCSVVRGRDANQCGARQIARTNDCDWLYY